MKRRVSLLATVFAFLLAGPVDAHSLTGRLVSPLPLAAYLGGAALAVSLSFAFVILRDVRAPERVSTQELAVPGAVVSAVRVSGLVGWGWIVAQLVTGAWNADAGVDTLFLWTYGWVGMALLSAVVGPVWAWLDPFATLFDIGAWLWARTGVGGWEPAPYPASLGAWPAVAGLAFVVWLELAWRGGSLGVVLVLYTVFTLLAMANFGRDPWRARAETFSVWFGTLNRLAPLGPPDTVAARTVRRRRFAHGLLEPGWTQAHVVLVGIGVASILYDGLSQTTIWAEVFGLPDLLAATLELAAFLGIVVALALGVSRLVGPAAVGAGLVPIAVGYLIAHYLTLLAADGQRLVVVISDPLGQGWDLFGTAGCEPNASWIPIGFAWAAMLAAVIGGHVIGAWSGHVVAVRDAPRSQHRRLRQVPLAVLMVALTATTLWSLGQAIVVHSEEPATGQAGPARTSISPVGWTRKIQTSQATWLTMSAPSGTPAA
jgi:hypothetical protein